jgi:hypothetical protein
MNSAATNDAGLVERFHPRVEANLMVKVLLNGRAVLVKAKDLSMAGVRLIGGPRVERDRLTIAIPLPTGEDVVTGARVRRVTKDGVAVEFDQLDWDDLCALARYLHPKLP